MLIRNFKKLATTPLRRKALEIIEAGYEALEIERAVSRRVKVDFDKLTISHIHPYENKTIDEVTDLDLDSFKRVFVVGIGKGSAQASVVLSRILGKYFTAAITLDICHPKFIFADYWKFLPWKFKSFRGTHPLPSEVNIQGTNAIMDFVKDLHESDLLITFICGGGSALVCSSKEELGALTRVIKELTKAAANITEMNVVRRHLSLIKGGGLSKAASPATIISLIISDVCGYDLATVASGPTVFDKTTKAEAEDILRKYNLDPAEFPLIETPKDENYFSNTKNILLICNQDGLMAMVRRGQDMGIHVGIYSLDLQGEAKESFFPMIQSVESNDLVAAAGETTVTLKSKIIGKGGRNQEAVLGALAKLTPDSQQPIADIVFASFASDGHDNTEAAGAIGDFTVLEKAAKKKLKLEEFLINHDAFNFFNKTGDLLFVEQKSFNVADLMIVLRE